MDTPRWNFIYPTQATSDMSGYRLVHSSSYAPTPISLQEVMLPVRCPSMRAVTELNSPCYRLKREMYFQIERVDHGVRVLWDHLGEYATGANEETAIFSLCQRIVHLYEELTDPLRANTQADDEKLVVIEQFLEQVSDPDDTGWRRAAAQTVLPRE
jgi:hypothetical protein